MAGSISYSRFLVRGTLPDDFRERFLEAVRLRAFRDLDPDEPVDQRAGWCAIENAYELDLQHEHVFFAGYLNLGFRVDRWRIPSSLFKASFRDAERAFLSKQGSEKLSRPQKKNLEAIVTRQLRRRVVPSMKVIDLSWHLADGVVRFFHPSPKQHEAMQELFEKTFELELAPAGTYLTAERRGLPEKALVQLHELEPMTLAVEAR